MSCCGEREKGPPEQHARWEFITLSDFKSSGLGAGLAYGWLWFMAAVAVAVYAVDTFTAVNLLAFNNWSSQVRPPIPFKYLKWIFSVCILISWVLLLFEWVRAVRVIRRDGVAESYMDPLAVKLQSMRSKGWRRFLVFKALTNSKKRIDYVALFVYFAFKGAIRVVLAEGPRQVVNAMTLYSVTTAKLVVHGAPTDNHSSFEQFFLNIQALAQQDDRQATILFSMLFTLIIWAFSALSLIAAVVLYLVFLWHYIPKRDARLAIYCRRKVDKRLEKIVEHKIKAAIEEENRQRERAEKKENKRAGMKRQQTRELPQPVRPQLTKQPTLPRLDDSDSQIEGKLAGGSLTRNDTNTSVATLPLYPGRPTGQNTVQRQPTLPDLGEEASRPGLPHRSTTQGSAWTNASFESDAPLLANAGFAGGDGRVQSPAPTYYSRQGSTSSIRPPMPPGRTVTSGSQSSQAPFNGMSSVGSPGSMAGRQLVNRQPSRMGSYQSQTNMGPPRSLQNEVRFESEKALSATDITASPQDLDFDPLEFPQGHGRNDSQVSYFSRPIATSTSATPPMNRTPAPRPGPGSERQPTFDNNHSRGPSLSRSVPPRNPTPASSNPYRAFSPPPSNPYRAFSPSSQNFFSRPDQPSEQPDSYEMTTRPAYSSAAPAAASARNGTGGRYVPFNPGMGAAPSRAVAQTPGPNHPTGYPPPSRSFTDSGRSGQQENHLTPHDGALQHPQPPRSMTASGWIGDNHGDGNRNHQGRVAYDDILDEY